MSDGAVAAVSVASPINALPCLEFANKESLPAFPCNWDAAGCRVQGGTTRSIHVWIFSCRARSSSRSLRRCLADSAVLRGVGTDCPWKWCDSGVCDMRWLCAASSAVIENGVTTCGRKLCENVPVAVVTQRDRATARCIQRFELLTVHILRQA